MKYMQNIIREAMRLYHPGKSCLPQQPPFVRFGTKSKLGRRSWKPLLTHGPIEKVGFNVRCAEIDTTLPRGGGPHGQDPISISAGTQICEFAPLAPLTLRTHSFSCIPRSLEYNESKSQSKQPTPSSPSTDVLTYSA